MKVNTSDLGYRNVLRALGVSMISWDKLERGFLGTYKKKPKHC